MLCDYPSSLSNHGSRFRFPATPVANLVGALVRFENLELHVIKFEHDISRSRVFRDPTGFVLHALPARRFSGMSLGFRPRAAMVHRYLEDVVRPDLVHGQGTEAGYGWMAVSGRWAHVVTMHGILTEIHSVVPPPRLGVEAIGRRVERATLRKGRNFIAVSPFVRGHLATHAPGASVFDVPNAVDPSFFDKERRPQSGHVCYVGRISPEKGLLDLLRAVKHLDDRDVDVTLEVVGAPAGRHGESYIKEGRDVAASLERNKVIFHGPGSPDLVQQVMSRARCVVLPSRIESAPMAAAEGLAMGVPIVGYRVAGLPTMVTEGENALLVEPGDVPALATAVQELVLDERLGPRFAATARRAAVAFRPERVAEQTLAVYHQLLGERDDGRVA